MNNPVGWRANALPLLFVAAGLILTGVLTDQPYTVGHAAETELRLAIRHSGRSVEYQSISRVDGGPCAQHADGTGMPTWQIAHVCVDDSK